MKTILAPIDFSSVTDAVVATAATLARALEGKVVLLTIIPPPAMPMEYAPLMADIAEITAAGEKNADRELAKIETQLRSDFVPVESLHQVGAPVPLILAQAEEISADYIVMGSHGHTALYDLLVGGTTHGVLMKAKCPVIIVPAVRAAPAKKPRKVQKVAV